MTRTSSFPLLIVLLQLTAPLLALSLPTTTVSSSNSDEEYGASTPYENNYFTTIKASTKVSTASPVDLTRSIPPASLLQQSYVWSKSNASVLLQGTQFDAAMASNGAMATLPSNGLADSMFSAYKNHHNLVLRPDDIWTAILVQFSYYVNAHSEQLRSKFVNFEGKRDLEVNYTGIGVHQVPFNHFISEMVSLVKRNLKNEDVASWVLPSFSTTTDDDLVTSGAVLMATLKNYFNYKLGMILCGVPEVTIVGTVEDWEDIRERVKRLDEFDVDGKNTLHKWSLLLDRVLQNFVQVKSGGDPEAAFWDNIARHDHHLQGCFRSTILSGWITVFSVFDTKGRWQVGSPFQETQPHPQTRGPHFLDLNGRERQRQCGTEDDLNTWPTLNVKDLTAGVVQVPIQIKDDNAYDLPNGEYKGVIFAGHVGHSVDPDGKTIQPISGWAVAVDGQPPAYLNNRI